MTQEELMKIINGINAKQVNIYMGDHASANYYESSSEDHHVKVSDEQISRAINAINGKDKVLKHQQAFLGICSYLASFYKWPNNMELSANRLMQLPGADEWELPCKWESIRKLLVLKFAKKDYSEWNEYKPNESELSIFRECRDVARAFEQQLQIEMQQ